MKKRKNKGETASEFDNILTGETDVALDENGNPYDVDSAQEENMFAMQLENPVEEAPKEETVEDEEEGQDLFVMEPEQKVEEIVEETAEEVTVTDEMREKTAKANAALNPADATPNEEHMAKPVQAPEVKQEEEFPTIVAPTFKVKGRGKRATYNKDEVDAQLAELVERYNANMIRLEKTHLKSLERKKTIERIFKDISTKQETLKTLVARIHELEDEVQEKENQIEELRSAPPVIVEVPVEVEVPAPAPEPEPEPELVVEPEPVVEETPVEIPVFDEETILSHTISVKLEEAEMEAHRIKLSATSQATEILAEAQTNAAELMRQAEAEIEELTRSITEAAEAKLVDAEKRQAKVTKLAKERQTVHRRLIRMYNQQIGRLEKQIKSYDDIINSPSE